MIINIKMTSNDKNFEKLYNDLKLEYEQSKTENDEICKEYESTIQILTDSVNGIKNEKASLELKLSKIESEQKALKSEKENLIKKNKDKMIDIDYLNTENEKLNELIKKTKEEKSKCDNKIVFLENDIDHYQSKLREYEEENEELKAQLEDALEENIAMQTEFETFKLDYGDRLTRKENELKDILSDIQYKDKIIQKLSKLPSEINNPDLKNIVEDNIKMRRRSKRFATIKKICFVDQNNRIRNEILNKQESKTKILKAIENKNFNIHNRNSEKKFKEIINGIYRKSLQTCKTSLNFNKDPNNENLNFENDDENDEENTNSVIDTARSRIDKNDIKNEIKTSFGNLIICEENRMYVNPLVKNMLNNQQKKNVTDNLKNMLSRIQQRKMKLLNAKKYINEKLVDKSGRVK